MPKKKQPHPQPPTLHTITVSVTGEARASIECVEGESYKLLEEFETKVRAALDGCEIPTKLDDVQVVISLETD